MKRGEGGGIDDAEHDKYTYILYHHYCCGEAVTLLLLNSTKAQACQQCNECIEWEGMV